MNRSSLMPVRLGLTRYASLALAFLLLLAATPFISAQTVSISTSSSSNGWGKGGKPKPTPTPSPKPADGRSDWNGTTNSDFNTGSNWTPNGVPPGSAPPVAGDVAWFSSTPSNKAVNLSSSVSIAGLYFNGTSASGYSLSATSPFTLTLTATGTAIGAETGDSTAVAIGAENASGTNTVSAPIVFAPTTGSTSTIFQAGGGTLTLSGAISGSGISLTKTGDGALMLNGSNSGFTGQWNVTAGALNILTSNSISSSNAVTLSSSGGFRVPAAGTTTIIGTLNGSGSGTIQTSSSTTTTGTLVVTQSVDGSVSNVLANGGTGANGKGILALTKSGGATLTLSGTNTYSGGTTVNSGTLLINNNSGSGTGTGTITVNNGGTLGGSGFINAGANTVTINSGGTLMAGTGTSTSDKLTVTGAVSMSNGSIIQLALGPSLAHSTLAVSGGSMSFATGTGVSSQMFTFSDLGATPGTYQDIITGVTDPGATISNWTITNPGYVGTFAYDSTDMGIDLTLTVVPEPSTWVAAALAFGVVGYSQRKRFACVSKRA